MPAGPIYYRLMIFGGEVEHSELAVVFFGGLIIGVGGFCFVVEVSEEFSFSVDLYLGEEFVFLVAEGHAAIL